MVCAHPTRAGLHHAHSSNTLPPPKKCPQKSARALPSSPAGRSACESLLEMCPPFIRAVGDETDDSALGAILLTLERMAVHYPEVSEHGLSAPLVARLDSPSAAIRERAARCAIVLCDDDVAITRLLEADLLPAMTRLASVERERTAFGTAAVAIGVLARLAADARFARRVGDTEGVQEVLLATVGPLHPDASPDERLAQRSALDALCHLGRTSEIRAGLSADPDFFPLLFRLRDSSDSSVSRRAHDIAAHWADDFFGWAWECCAASKGVAERLMIEAKPSLDVDAPPNARGGGEKQRTHGGVEQYAAQLSMVSDQLQDFLGHANEVAHGLLQAQGNLEAVGLARAHAIPLGTRNTIHALH